MFRARTCFVCAVLLAATLAPAASAVDVNDTLMLHSPAISASHVAFGYAGDLWIAERGDAAPLRARRLTSHLGREGLPYFSPDGKQVAFSAEYDGNIDVFVVGVEGGEPRRLTWHSAPDMAVGFTPEGEVLFASGRVSHTRRHRQLFTLSTEGGHPTQLPIPNGWQASYSPDGQKIAYRPQRDVFWQWKNYRGGTHGIIWIYDVNDHSVVEIPQPEGVSNDTAPMWIGDAVYFLSDRAGEFNVFRYDPASEAVNQITHHEDFPVLSANAGDGRMIYEQAGRLHVLDPANGATRLLKISAAADLADARPRWVDGYQYVRSGGLSPAGERAVLEFRGEIVTVPAEKGDPRNLSNTPGAHERSPTWSPDGHKVAYFSDASGEYALHVRPQNGKGKVKTYKLGGTGYYTDLSFSPDGEKVSYKDNSRTLYWLDLESGEEHRVDGDHLYGPFDNLEHDWAPDSRWIAYTRNNAANFQEVYLYELESGQSRRITDGLSNVVDPVFDASGKYLFFLASTDAGPVQTWFAQSNADMEASYDLYMAVLAKGEPSPLAPESDEVKVAKDEAKGNGNAKGDETKGKGKDKKDDAKGEDGDDEDGDDTPPVVVDFDGIDQRILSVPVESGFLSDLATGSEGQIYYVRREIARAFGGPPGALQRYDLKKREESKMADGVVGFSLSADGSKVLVATPGGLLLGGAQGELKGGKNSLDIDNVRVRIEPRSEWPQIFHEAWRINRDYFYDPGMHGADWDAMREKYAAFLPHLANRDDLNRLISWMCSEVAVGHHRNGGGDFPNDVDDVPGGLLGADFEIHEGRYRFARILGGLNWNPDLRSPLTEPGVEVEEGEYLLAVEGQELRAPENLYALFEHTADRHIELKVGPNADGSDSRTVKVVPIESESALRNRDWVEGNLARVTEATDGRVAYVHVPDTAGQGHTYFKRYFFPQSRREAIIVDERYNGGGQIADYYIDILRRQHYSHWATRYGADLPTPLGAIRGPKVMLIDETAGSGGDMLPYLFRKLELGPLVGTRTWGGLVGILGFPTLMDGGFVTAPNIAIWTEEGFIVENVGVPPDIEVEQLPAEIIAGRDPQLEKAIEIALEMLEANPPVEPERPPFPIRARQ